jgi:hypothetical protein
VADTASDRVAILRFLNNFSGGGIKLSEIIAASEYFSPARIIFPGNLPFGLNSRLASSPISAAVDRSNKAR